MNERESQPSSNEETDPYANWTEDQRASYFAETGDASCLTSDMAVRYKLPSELLASVPGVPEDIIRAAEEKEEHEARLDQVEVNELLKRFDADIESLEQQSFPQQFRSLLDAATYRIASSKDDERMWDEAMRDAATQGLFDRLLQIGGSMYCLFEALRLDQPQGLDDIRVAEKLLEHLTFAYEQGNPNAPQSTEELDDVADQVLAQGFIPSANYLGSERLSQLLKVQSGRERQLENMDYVIPFEITNGSYAIFSADDTICVADSETSADIGDIIRTAWSSEYQGEDGHAIPSYQYQYVPEELLYAGEWMFDAGETVDEIASRIDGLEEGVVGEYVELMRSRVRSIVEQKFSVKLKDLTLKEQLYFTQYLKNVTVGEAQTVQAFTSNPEFGVNALRTFLSLERYGQEFGDAIVETANKNPEEAQQIFSYYGTLLDRADDAESIVADAYNGDVPPEVLETVRNKMLAKADSTLKQMTDESKLEHIVTTIQNSSDEAAGFGETFSALKSAGLVESPEDMNLQKRQHTGAEVLSDDDLLLQVESLYQQHYDEKTAADFMQTFRSKLEQPGAVLTTMSILEDQIVATLLEVNDGDQVYVGALNTSLDQSAQSLQLGTHMIKNIVERKAEAGKVLNATATVDKIAAYVNRYKFVITGSLGTIANGKILFKMERNDSVVYESAAWKDAQVRSYASQSGDSVLVKRISSVDPIPSELEEEYVCTKLVRDGEDMLYVLEKPTL